MQPDDVPSVALLLRKYLAKFALHREFDDDDAAIRLLPRSDFIHTFVAKDPKGNVTHVGSFYTLQARIRKQDAPKVWLPIPDTMLKFPAGTSKGSSAELLHCL